MYAYDIFIMVLFLQVWHFLADYILQVPWHYENKGKNVGWFYPLLHHSSVHALGTLMIVSIYATIWFTILMGLLQLSSHFAVDRWKATLPYTPDQQNFWLALGADQYYHHTTCLLIVVLTYYTYIA